jgi:hypothetical protein
MIDEHNEDLILIDCHWLIDLKKSIIFNSSNSKYKRNTSHGASKIQKSESISFGNKTPLTSMSRRHFVSTTEAVDISGFCVTFNPD